MICHQPPRLSLTGEAVFLFSVCRVTAKPKTAVHFQGLSQPWYRSRATACEGHVIKIIFAALLIVAPSIAAAEQAHVGEGAVYLPDKMMPQLQAAISLVAKTQIGCANIDNASFSETYGTEKSPAFFVSCTMKNKPFEFQNVFKMAQLLGPSLRRHRYRSKLFTAPSPRP